MKSAKDFLARATLIGLGWVGSLVLWTVWLAIVLILAFQLYIVSANELSLPPFILRQAEARLADSGIRATFARTTFDTSGRVLVENVQLSLPGFADPIVTARAVHVRLSPWFLAMGRVEPREVEVMGLTADVPSILSPTGQPETVVRDLNGAFELSGHTLTLQRLGARVLGVDLVARGRILLPRQGRSTAAPTPAEPLAKRFSDVCRQVLAAAEQVARLDEPRLRLELEPSESGAPIIRIQALARGLRLDQPAAIEAQDLQLTTSVLLFGDAPPSDIAIAARRVQVAGDATLEGLQARVVGRYRLEERQFDLREIEFTTRSLSAAGVGANAVSARIIPRLLPRLEATVAAQVLGEPLGLRVEADLGSRQGNVRFDGMISPRVLDVVSQRVGTNVSRFFDFESLRAQDGEVRFGPGWKFERLRARVAIPRMNSYGVIMEDGRTVVELTPQRFSSPEAFARVGENFAAGTYEHDLTTHRYRFLLDGRLRPVAISRWFREWWSNFFQQLEFPTAPPDASVDVRGTWRDGSQSRVFVFADVPKPVIRGTPLDRVRTRLFIRPAFYDALEIFATSGSGAAAGTFTYLSTPETFAWRSLDLRLDSTLDLAVISRLLGPLAGKTLAPIQLAQPPRLGVEAEFVSEEAPGGAVEKLRIDARTTGGFRYHGFPLQDVSFVAAVNRNDVSLDNIEARFGGGSVTGHARVWGAGAERRLGFDLALVDSSLGLVASGLEEYFSSQAGRAPAPPGKFVQEKANVRLDLAASAEGRYDNTYSYRGDGSAVLRGAELGEVPLLGTLSELFKFTALRFTEARGNFKIDGAKLVFPEFSLRGSNSKIDAHGTYALDRGTLDFNAKLYPFQESENILKSVVGAVLTPLSNAFEVKLKGSLEKPEWTFVRGPTNFLRALSPGEEAAPADGAPPADRPAPPSAPGPVLAPPPP